MNKEEEEEVEGATAPSEVKVEEAFSSRGNSSSAGTRDISDKESFLSSAKRELLDDGVVDREDSERV